MNKSINTLEKNKCNGCSACEAICPTEAITMKYEKDGFLYPNVNYDKCTNCGLCSNICPELNFNNKNYSNPVCYAVQSNDDIRKKSTSGGVFTILSNYVFEQGGYVCGVAFNDNFEVGHIIIDNEEDLYKLRGSKYIQSNKFKVLKKIKEILDNNKLLLFSGCPCEVAGLKNFLQKDYDNLITIDLLCGSVLPPIILEKIINENFKEKEINKISFRDKTPNGWGSQFNVYLKDGTMTQEYSTMFWTIYRSWIIARYSCSKCSFATLPRIGDITIGDFWDINKYNTNLDDHKGTSMVLINNDKGNKIYHYIEKDLKLSEEIPISFIKDTANSPLLEEKRDFPINPQRELFYFLLKDLSLNKVYSAIFNNKYDMGIFNFCISNNFGSILTSYAIYKSLIKLGYLPKIIAYLPPHMPLSFAFPKKMQKKYFYSTNILRYYHELEKLNNEVDTFIVGSDQVWLYNAEHYCIDYLADKFRINNMYFLSFVNYNKKLISFAASFGHESYNCDYYNKLLTSYDLTRFDHISVREEIGVKICKETFNIDNVEQVIEPVFLLDDEDYNEIISDSTITDKGKLAYYLLDPTKEKYEAIDYVANKLGIIPVDVSNNLSNEIEDFLYMLKNADFIISDSFHGACFSSIFKKKFISFINVDRGITRYSIFKKLGLGNRFIYNPLEVKNREDLYEEINWDIFDKVREEEKKKAISWLKEAIESKNKKTLNKYEEIIEYLINENNYLNSRYYEHINHFNEHVNHFNEHINYYNTEKNDIIDTINRLNSYEINIYTILNNLINSIAWWIPTKKWRDKFRSKIFKIDQKTRPDQTRPDQTRPDQTSNM